MNDLLHQRFFVARFLPRFDPGLLGADAALREREIVEMRGDQMVRDPTPLAIAVSFPALARPLRHGGRIVADRTPSQHPQVGPESTNVPKILKVSLQEVL